MEPFQQSPGDGSRSQTAETQNGPEERHPRSDDRAATAATWTDVQDDELLVLVLVPTSAHMMLRLYVRQQSKWGG